MSGVGARPEVTRRPLGRVDVTPDPRLALRLSANQIIAFYPDAATTNSTSAMTGKCWTRGVSPYPCCFERESPLTVYAAMAIAPACICCRAILCCTSHLASRLPCSAHRSARSSHFPLCGGSSFARWRYISSIARQFSKSLMAFFPVFFAGELCHRTGK
jgi:hypothetical protein